PPRRRHSVDGGVGCLQSGGGAVGCQNPSPAAMERRRLERHQILEETWTELVTIVDANLGQYTNALDRAVRERTRCSSPCVERSDRSKGPVRPVTVENRRRPTNAS